MKKLFTAIRHKDIDTVKQLIEAKPGLVNCTAKQPPKKDDGQSPLQVALKTGNFDIAEYLIDSGADLNFIEDESCCNEWRMPVVQDAINAAVMCCRWNTNTSYTGFKVYSTKERADLAYAVLKKMIDAGADVNAVDSHGSSGIWRFCMQSGLILPAYNYVDHTESTERLFTDELREDLVRILRLLVDAGADTSYVSPNFGKPVLEFYTEGPIARLLREVL